MRNMIIGIVIGLVVGMVVGSSVIAPRLTTAMSPPGAAPAAPAVPAIKTVRAPDHRWNLASTYPDDMPLYGALVDRLSTRLHEALEGRLDLRVYKPDSIVPVDGVLDAVADGRIDATFASPDRWTGESPVLGLFGGAPFGPPPWVLLSWYRTGGGVAFHAAAYADIGVVGLPCGLDGPQVPGWFRRPLTGVESFRDLRVAASGLEAEVLRGLGAQVTRLAMTDLVPALKLHAVDAVFGKTPAADRSIGLGRTAPHTYWPSWHHQGGLLDLVVNREAWEALDPSAQASLRAICEANLAEGLAAAENQFGALKDMQKAGFKARPWPPEVLAALRAEWTAVAERLAEDDPTFEKAARSLDRFLATHEIWRDLSVLPAPE